MDAGDDEETAQRYIVHRWTAHALAKHATASALADAHRRAASYWHWRVTVWPQSRQDDISQLIEARHHYHAAGDIDQAVNVTIQVCAQLDTWGAWVWEERLLRETLTWTRAGSRAASSILHQLGIVTYWRGDYEQALDWYRQSLTISEELGNRASMATSYHQLGMIAHERGDYEQALGWYRKSLTIKEELGNRDGMANSYHQLGVLAEQRGDYEQALDWYRQSLALEEERGDRAGMAYSFGQLGLLAQRQGDLEQAFVWTRQALEVVEELGDQPGIARAHSQLGVLLTESGRPDAAVPFTLTGLLLRATRGYPGADYDIHWLSRQRELLGDGRFSSILREQVDEETAGSILQLLSHGGA
jgi:tetratricopeptide (TPR) repeat protein